MRYLGNTKQKYCGYLSLTDAGVFLLCIDEVACAEPEVCREICGNPVGCSDIAYAKLVMELLPAGERLFLLHLVSCFMLYMTSLLW